MSTPYPTSTVWAGTDSDSRSHHRLWVGIAFSLLAHLLLFTIPGSLLVPIQNDNAERPRHLVVRIQAPPRPKTQRQAVPEPATASPEKRKQSAEKLPAKARVARRSRQPSSPNMSAQVHTPDTAATKISPVEPPSKFAAQLMDDAEKAAPKIAENIEENSHLSPDEVFDPKFRTSLEKARRDESKHDALLRALRQQPQVTIVALSREFVEFRLDGKCWRMPRDASSDPFDPRIIKRTSNCPKPRNELLAPRPQIDLPH